MSYSQVTTSRAKFRILHRYEGKGILPADLPSQFEAVLVEMVHTRPIADINERVKAYVSGLEKIKDFSLLLERIKKNQARIYFGDLAENQVISSARDFNLMILEFWSGIISLFWGIRLLFKKIKKKRKLAGYLLAPWFFILLGFWSLTSVFEVFGLLLVNAAGNIAKKSFLKGVRETVAKASHLHPEKTVVFLRNLILAEKAWEIADLEKKNDRLPLIVLDLHFGHAGIAEMLKWSQNWRLILFKLYQPFIKEILADKTQRDYLARLINVFWDKDRWQIGRNYLIDSLEYL